MATRPDFPGIPTPTPLPNDAYANGVPSRVKVDPETAKGSPTRPACPPTPPGPGIPDGAPRPQR